MKKRFLSLSLLALCTVVLAGCSNGNDKVDDGGNNDGPHTDLVTPPTYDEDSFQIHYYRPDRAFSKWALWLWTENKTGAEFAFNGVDDYGAVASYKLSEFGTDLPNSKLGFIVKSAGGGDVWDAKDPDGDRFVDFSIFSKNDKGVYNIYLKTDDSNIYSASDWVIADGIEEANLYLNPANIYVQTTTNVKSYIIYKNGELFVENSLSTVFMSFRYWFPTDQQPKIGDSYSVTVTFDKTGAKLSKDISTRILYSTDDFANEYNYDGNDLGAVYASDKTTFKVWSPVSTSIKLRIYTNGTPVSVSSIKGNDTYDEYEMVKGEKGVFSYVINGDIGGKYYTYFVKNSSYKDGKEIVDPYAKSCGVNGLRGMIVDFSKTNPDNWVDVSPKQFDKKSLVVYETHVSDLTSSSTWTGTETNRYKFNGAKEEGTTYSKDGVTVTTGIDHIKEMGVNAVQLLPIFDQANDEINLEFNWGYNPLNYNCVEGGYSSDPYNGYSRIKELKELIKTYNTNDINIIMDVVYNHVNGALGSNFDVLMPGYYFRYNGSLLSNGSGCGNETASDMYMYRKFMIDSTSFWASEYKLGGFRFDLMGLHDIETMDKVTEKLKTINPAIAVYGEPWTGGASPLADKYKANQANADKFVGYGQFNDQMRDALIKGGMNAAKDKGWADNTTSIDKTDVNKIIAGLKGFTFGATNDPDKTVNYVTCHDNFTLNDRFNKAEITDESTVEMMSMLANSVALTSQGTSFMLAGEEFLRTKGGDGNSYSSTYKVNELDYSLKIKNADMYQNYIRLIDYKTGAGCARFDKDDVIDTSKLNVVASSTKNEIISTLVDSINNKDVKIIYANGYEGDGYASIDLTGYSVFLDTLGELSSGDTLTQFTPKAYQTLIVSK